MSNTFFVADTHVSHTNILKYTDRGILRPGDLDAAHQWVSHEIALARCEEMNEGIRNVWNATIHKDDTVYIVGDFCWHSHRHWVQALNGKKILLIGSHDKMPQDTLDMFKADPTEYDLTQAELMKNWIQFREVHQSLIRKICGIDMQLYHWPARTWQGRNYMSWMCAGHVHGRIADLLPEGYKGGCIIDVGWDVWKRPVSVDELKPVMQKKWELWREWLDLQNAEVTEEDPRDNG